MADQIEVSKLTQYAFHQATPDEVAVAKLVMYVWLTPGEDSSAPPATNRQSFCYGQRIRRRR